MTHAQEEKRAIAATLFNPTDRYADIMRLPHHQSTQHRHMTNRERAPQFAPFAALTGYNDLLASSGQAVVQAARLPAEKAQLLEHRLHALADRLAQKPWVTLTYFEAETGESEALTTRVKAVDFDRQCLTLPTDQLLAFDQLQALDL